MEGETCKTHTHPHTTITREGKAHASDKHRLVSKKEVMAQKNVEVIFFLHNTRMNKPINEHIMIKTEALYLPVIDTGTWIFSG